MNGTNPSVNATNPLVPLATTTTTVFYLPDERGNTAMRLDRNGVILSAHVTDAFGATKTRDYVGSSADDPFAGFGGSLGYMRESGLDLYRCGLRFYDVANARWLTRDPIGYDGGQNLYGYVSGNPVMAVDPMGLMDFNYGLMQDTMFSLLFGTLGSNIGGWGGGALGTLIEPVGGTAVGYAAGSLGGGIVGAGVGVGISRWVRGADDWSGIYNSSLSQCSSKTGRPHKEGGYHGPKPQYEVNDAHVPNSPLFNPRKTPLPPDAETLYRRAIPEPDGGSWWVKVKKDLYYRYQGGGGRSHFNGAFNENQAKQLMDSYVYRRLNQ